jgi:hypothetical protein
MGIYDLVREENSQLVEACQVTGRYCEKELKLCLVGYSFICPYQKLEKNATYTCTKAFVNTYLYT